MDKLTLFNAYSHTRTHMVVIEHTRGTNRGICVNIDPHAMHYQRRERLARKINHRMNGHKYCYLCGYAGGKPGTRNHDVTCSLWGKERSRF